MLEAGVERDIVRAVLVNDEGYDTCVVGYVRETFLHFYTVNGLDKKRCMVQKIYRNTLNETEKMNNVRFNGYATVVLLE